VDAADGAGVAGISLRWALALALLAAFGVAQKPYFALHEVAPGVFAAIGTPGSGAGSNAGFIIGDNGVLVIDTFQKVEAARALLAAIREKTALPVRFVVNTHYHLDHVTGNQVFADAGATIMAQRNVRAWIHTENLKFFGPHPTAAAEATVAGLRAPDLVYDDGVEIDLGRRRVEVAVRLGHTGGDSVVRTGDVLFTGDLFWRHSLPNLIDETTAPLLTTLRGFTSGSQAATVFVPGHGEVGTAADVGEFRGYIEDLQRDTPTELAAKYSGWSGYSHFIGPNLADVAAERSGTKKLPRPGA
jgi:glyoxylase-like metal-dependent hydrolase (beta-lactamase superfamily II)